MNGVLKLWKRVIVLVDAVLHSLDDAVLPAANWVSSLLDFREDVEEATSLKITTEELAHSKKYCGTVYAGIKKQHYQPF